MGFEPTTSALGRLHSTTELRPHRRLLSSKDLQPDTLNIGQILVRGKGRLQAESNAQPGSEYEIFCRVVHGGTLGKRGRPHKPYARSPRFRSRSSRGEPRRAEVVA